MDITDYCTLGPDSVRFDEEGASRFAKGVAGDFNPIHDPGSKRFCVPGDLLFGVLLHRYGAFGETTVRFAGMLDAEVELALPAGAADRDEADRDEAGGAGAGEGASERRDIHLSDARGREILSLFGSGPCFDAPGFIAGLTHEYVRFSGRTFPEILVPLMRETAMMINPERPLVIYKDMALRIDEARAGAIDLTLTDADLSVNGKKGVARLRFDIVCAGERIGEGEKNLVLGGLRAFDEAAMARVVAEYSARRDAFVEDR